MYIFPSSLLSVPFRFSTIFDFHALMKLMHMVSATGDANDEHATKSTYFDPRFRRILWYLIASTRGGASRAKMLDLIKSTPSNANQIAIELKIDYKTAIHHLKVLSENDLIITDKEGSYGATYFLTPLMEKNYGTLREILNKVGGKDAG